MLLQVHNLKRQYKAYNSICRKTDFKYYIKTLHFRINSLVAFLTLKEIMIKECTSFHLSDGCGEWSENKRGGASGRRERQAPWPVLPPVTSRLRYATLASWVITSTPKHNWIKCNSHKVTVTSPREEGIFTISWRLWRQLGIYDAFLLHKPDFILAVTWGSRGPGLGSHLWPPRGLTLMTYMCKSGFSDLNFSLPSPWSCKESI